MNKHHRAFSFLVAGSMMVFVLFSTACQIKPTEAQTETPATTRVSQTSGTPKTEQTTASVTTSATTAVPATETYSTTEVTTSESTTAEITTTEAPTAATATPETTTVAPTTKEWITDLDSDLPVFYINGNIAAISENEKGHEEECTYQFVGPGNNFSGNMTVKGRGNTAFRYAKKCFKLKLEEKNDFLGMGANRHWVLIANWTDGSFMRNHLAYTLSSDFGLVSMDGTWVDVVVNGEYYGNYYLCEHIRVNKNRIDITTVEDACKALAKNYVEQNKDNWTSWIPEDHLAKIASEYLSWVSTDYMEYAAVPIQVSDYYEYSKEQVIGSGYLLEIDSGYNENSRFMSSLKRPVMIHEPEWACGNEEMMQYLEDLINAFEKGLSDGTFQTEYKGKTLSIYDIFDIDSLVAYFWVQEIFMNTDGWYRSTYFYKDADAADGTLSKFKMGPVWDMDFSSGGMRDTGEPYPTNTWGFKEFVPFAQEDTGWHKYLMQDPAFQEKVYDFYQQHRADIQKMMDSIDGCQTYLADSIEQDKAVWGVWRNEFDTEVTILKSWLSERIQWLDIQMESLSSFQQSIRG